MTYETDNHRNADPRAYQSYYRWYLVQYRRDTAGALICSYIRVGSLQTQNNYGRWQMKDTGNEMMFLVLLPFYIYGAIIGYLHSKGRL